MEKSVDELYGACPFFYAAGKDITKWPSLSEANTSKDIEPTITVGVSSRKEVVRDNRKGRSFSEVVVNGMKSLNYALNGEDEVLPLKPLASRKVEGGNLVIRIEDDDYLKGMWDLIFSMVGKLSLQMGILFPLQWN